MFVDSEHGLAEAARALASASLVYLDTEFDSTRDGSTLCLLQVSAGETVYLVDTLRLRSLDALAPIFRDPKRTWVLHAGSQDVDLLTRRFALAEPPSLVDTQVAWALQSAEFSVSLAYLKYRVLGVRSGKPHQADDWRRRPLPASQLEYASSDVADLPALYAELARRLGELGRMDAARDASREVDWPVREPAESVSVSSFRNAWQLDVHTQAALRFLVEWFNALTPDERAGAPEAKTLLSIANRLPASADDLARIKGVSRRFVERRGAALVSGLQAAVRSADARDFVPIEPVPYATFEQIKLDGWLGLVRAEICAALRVAPELAFPSRIVAKMRDAITNRGDRSAGAEALTGWRKELLARAFVDYARR